LRWQQSWGRDYIVHSSSGYVQSVVTKEPSLHRKISSDEHITNDYVRLGLGDMCEKITCDSSEHITIYGNSCLWVMYQIPLFSLSFLITYSEPKLKAQAVVLLWSTAGHLA